MLTAFGLHLGQVKDALVDKLEELGHRRRGLQRMDKEAVAAQQHSYAESILKAAKKTAVAAHLASEDNASPGSPRGQIPTEAPMDDSLNFDELCCGLCDILDDHFSGESDFILERDDISKLHALQCNDKKVSSLSAGLHRQPSNRQSDRCEGRLRGNDLAHNAQHDLDPDQLHDHSLRLRVLRGDSLVQVYLGALRVRGTTVPARLGGHT